MVAIQLNKETSQVLIQTLYQKEVTSLTCFALLDYLTMELRDDALVLGESLRAALLQDLQKEFAANKHPITEQISKKTWLHWFEWTLLALSGTVYAACDGFDGITTILALFPKIPLGFIFVAGFAFALLSVFVFYGFYLIDISDESHIGSKEQNLLMDIRLEQLNSIHELISASEIILKRSEDLDELTILQKMLPILNQFYLHLHEEKKAYEHRLKNFYLRFVKGIVSIFSGVLFFGYGFFGGQSLALTLVSLFVPSTVVTFWPVMAISLAVGLAAWSVYWLVERPNLENLVGRCFGLDEKKIDKLPNETITHYQIEMVDQMISDLSLRILTIQAGFTSQSAVMSMKSRSHPEFNGERVRFFGANNRKRSLSMGDISSTAHWSNRASLQPSLNAQ